MENLKKTQRRRIYFAVFFSVVWACAIVWRLVVLQVSKTDELQTEAQRQQLREIEVQTKRGTIYDRNGRELAISREVESCVAYPPQVTAPETAATKLAEALGEPKLRKELVEKLRAKKDFVYIRRKLPADTVEKIRKLDLDGVGFVNESKRFYPKDELACHLLGYVGLDNTGLAGIEYEYDRDLSGAPGKEQREVDARRREFAKTTLTPNQPAKNIFLTIDEFVQYIVEDALREAIVRHHARGGTVIVMNPRTGDILAMASWPAYNPNSYGEQSEALRRNRSIEDAYEPGSTFKIIIAGATLMEKTARIEDRLDCQLGAIELAGHRIRDHKPFGILTVGEIIEHSSNVGSIKLGLRLGDERLYHYMRQFGFGMRTGIDLPGENPGILRRPGDWSAISIGALCMGQEVSTTALQILVATSAVANGGCIVRPRIVRQMVSTTGSGWEMPTSVPPRRVLSPEVSGVLRDILTEVVERGTGIAARMDGFSTAGKTGTAQKIDPATGQYASGKYVSSFVGFTPVDNPALAMIVVIDEPKGSYYGGLVAAPVYKLCAEKILHYMNIFPERRQSVSPMLRYASLSPEEQLDLVAEGSDLDIAVGSPAAPLVVPAARTQTVPELPPVASGEPAFPDLRGMTIREAARILASLHIDFDATGSGYVVTQSPPAGTSLGKVTRCRLVLDLQRRPTAP
ncbi:MAG: penicillin-binding transpeptidase domain-containing protein [Acidobacteriota bacterium]